MDTSEYLPMFLAECRENLQELNLAVVALEEAPEDRETVDAIFRIAHSLKGMAATMGFEGMATLTHKMEDVFELLRQRGTGLTGEVVDVLLACLDALSGAVDAIDADGSEGFDPAALVERLGGLVRGRDDRDAADEPEVETATPPAKLAPVGGGRTVLEIHAVLAPDVQMPAVRAFQVLAAAAEHGDVLRSAPTEGDVDGFAGGIIEILLATDHEVDEVAAAVRAVPDVRDARAAEATAAEPVELPAPLAAVEEDGTLLPAETAAAPQAAKKGGQHLTVRVDAERLDQLMHLMGELVVQRTHVEALSADAAVPGLGQAMQELTRSSHAMVMQIRMIPIEAVFMRFPRLVRDVATRLGKQVELDLVGKETELDRTVVDAIGDPLVHLIRNALDHGLESPADRIAAGKAPTGKVTIAARHAGGSIAITVSDDGHGVNPQKVAAVAVARGLITREQVPLIDMRAAIELLFAPGFSTAPEVGDLSGRGVGMDAVRAKIRELGGEVTVTSVQGEGTINEIRLPLTLAIMSALVVEAGGQPFGIPLQRVERTMRIDDHPIRSVAGAKMLVLADEALPLRRGVDVFGCGPRSGPTHADTHIVIVRGQEGAVALSVSKLIGQRELVTRPLPPNVGQEAAVSGAAVLSNGDIVLLADCDALTLNTHPALSVAERVAALGAAV